MTTTSGDQLDVIFDGTSAFYTAVRSRLDASERITWVACQATAPGEHGRLCERTLVAITAEGEVDTGWRAFARALSAARGARWPSRVATAPVICPLMSMVFGGVAPLLRRIPGVTPWCELHPEECRQGG